MRADFGRLNDHNGEESMKKIAMLVAVVGLFVAATSFAANFDGTYTFQSRTKDGKADLAGWKGTMTIGNNEMSRTYTSPDGKDQKFYVGTMKQEGDLVAVKFTKAYKPEYVGNVHKNKLEWQGSALTMTSDDGKFKEVWTKK